METWQLILAAMNGPLQRALTMIMWVILPLILAPIAGYVYVLWKTNFEPYNSDWQQTQLEGFPTTRTGKTQRQHAPSLIVLGKSTRQYQIEEKGIKHKCNALGQKIRTLYLRRIINPTYETMLKMPCGNPFFAEYNVFASKIFPIADYAVMRSLTDTLPIICEQEAEHAVSHMKANRSLKKVKSDSAKRYYPFWWLFQLIALRSGPAIRNTTIGALEASFWVTMYYTAPYVGGCNVYHALEELEHGILTVNAMITKVNFPMRCLGYPIFVLLYTFLYFLPLPVAFVLDPTLVFYPSTYLYMVTYLIEMAFCWILSLTAILWNWVLAFPMWENLHHGMYMNLLELSKERGLKYEIKKIVDVVVGVPSCEVPTKMMKQAIPLIRRSMFGPEKDAALAELALEKLMEDQELKLRSEE